MKKWCNALFKWQIVLTVLLSFILFTIQRNPLNLINIVLLLLSFFFMYKGTKHVSRILNIVVSPYIFLYDYCNILKVLIKSFANFDTVLYVLYFIGMLVILIPVIVNDYGNITKPILQLAATIWLIISLFFISFSLINIGGSQFIIGLNKSQLLLALIFLEYTYLAITGWGYRFRFNLKIKDSTVIYYLFLLILMGITVWISLFNIFVLSASDWSQAFCFWKWDFSLINPNESATMHNIWNLYFSALDAGIMEESARYIFLLTLLTLLSKRKGRTSYSIIISSLIFSVLHILSFSTPGATVNYVVFKILHSFGWGCLLGIIFLYSGKLWLTMALHAFADYLSYSVTPLGYGGILANNGNTEIVELAAVTIIPLILAAIILYSKTARSIIDKNISKYVENTKVAAV